MVWGRGSKASLGKRMADQIDNNGGGQVDFQHHARDYTRMIKLLKWGAIAAFLVALLVMIIVSS